MSQHLKFLSQAGTSGTRVVTELLDGKAAFKMEFHISPVHKFHQWWAQLQIRNCKDTDHIQMGKSQSQAQVSLTDCISY